MHDDYDAKVAAKADAQARNQNTSVSAGTIVPAVASVVIYAVLFWMDSQVGWKVWGHTSCAVLAIIIGAPMSVLASRVAVRLLGTRRTSLAPSFIITVLSVGWLSYNATPDSSLVLGIPLGPIVAIAGILVSLYLWHWAKTLTKLL